MNHAHGMALGGAAAMLLGGVVLIARFALFELGGPYGSAINGASIGLMVVGVQLFRRSAWAHERPPARMLALAPIPLVFLTCMTLMWSRLADVSPDVELQPRSVQGYRISLPDWDVRGASSHAVAGNYVVDDPAGEGRLVELRWSDAPADAVGLPEEMFTSPPLSAEVKRRLPTQVASMASEILYLEAPGGKRIALTVWRCPGDHRNAYLMSFLHMETEPLLVLHERIVRSVACEGTPAGSGPTFPAYATPEGFQVMPDASNLTLLRDDGQVVLSFAAGSPGKDVLVATASGEPKAADLVRTLLERSFEGRAQDLVGPRQVTSGTQAPRSFWSVDMHQQDGTAAKVVATLWYCPGVDLTFIGLYLDADGTRPVAEEAERLLMAAECPGG